MTFDDVMTRLADLSSPDLLARNASNGGGSVPMGDISRSPRRSNPITRWDSDYGRRVRSMRVWWRC